MISFLGVSSHGMRVGPAPLENKQEESEKEKGERFKKTCLDLAKTALPTIGQYITLSELIRENNIRNGVIIEEVKEEELEKLAILRVISDLIPQIKLALKQSFPQAPLLHTPIALYAWAEKEADRYLAIAREQNKKKSCWNCFECTN